MTMRVNVKASVCVPMANGKIVETWVNFDALGMLQQLGMVPVPGAAH